MEQFTAQGEVTREGLLRIEVPCDLPPGPVAVSVVIQGDQILSNPDWHSLYGLGSEIWKEVDPCEYLRELRSDRMQAQ